MRQTTIWVFKQIHCSKHWSSSETAFVLTRDYKQEIQPRMYCVYIKSIWTQSMGLLIIPSDLPTHKVTKFCTKSVTWDWHGLLYKCIYASKSRPKVSIFKLVKICVTANSKIANSNHVKWKHAAHCRGLSFSISRGLYTTMEKSFVKPKRVVVLWCHQFVKHIMIIFK